MEPQSDENLGGFLARFDVAKAFILVPAVRREGQEFPKILYKKGILKRQLNVRQAWEIALNDMEVMALRDDDDPIIPENQQEAPIIDVIRWLREHNSQF